MMEHLILIENFQCLLDEPLAHALFSQQLSFHTGETESQFFCPLQLPSLAPPPPHTHTHTDIASDCPWFGPPAFAVACTLCHPCNVGVEHLLHSGGGEEALVGLVQGVEYALEL